MLTEYGAPITVDTTRVCQTWNGTDFSIRVTLAGSSEAAVSGGLDSARSGEWHSGISRVLDPAAADLVPARFVGGTLLDVMDADAATRAAIADDPYFELASLTECVDDGGDLVICSPDACDQQISCDPSSASLRASEESAPMTSARNTTAADDRIYTKHKLKRRGVRALLEGYSEEPSTDPARRRFKRLMADGHQLVSLHKKTQLILEQEFADSTGLTVVRHHWKKRNGGFVRRSSEETTTENLPYGRPRSSQSVTTYADIQINGQNLSAP